MTTPTGRGVVAGVIAAGLALTGCGLAQPAIANTATTNTTPTCNPAAVTTQRDGLGGILIHVNVQGPDALTVDLYDGFNDKRLYQQIPPKENEAAFDYPELGPIMSVSIVVQSKNHGTCELPYVAVGL